MTYGGNNYYYVLNLQGDVVAILNSSGSPVVYYVYDAWGRVLSTNGSMASTLGRDNLRYRGYVYDRETGLYYLQSRYYNPTLGRFINADEYIATGQSPLGNNMFAYCLNNPVNQEDRAGTFSYNSSYTVSLGGVVAVGFGPLSMSLQLALVTDSAGVTEIQISYSAPNIFSSGLPATDEMLADITSESSNYKFGVSLAGTATFTDAPSVSNLYGPTYSVGGAIPGVSVDYNVIPVGDGSDDAYSGMTVTGGMVAPGFNAGMSNTVFGFSVPFSVFDIIEAMYNGIYGR